MRRRPVSLGRGARTLLRPLASACLTSRRINYTTNGTACVTSRRINTTTNGTSPNPSHSSTNPNPSRSHTAGAESHSASDNIDQLADTKLVDTSWAPILFEKLKLSSYSDAELRRAFEQIDKNKSDRLEVSEVRNLLDEKKIDAMTSAVFQSLAAGGAAKSSSSAVGPSAPGITFEDFQQSVKRLASQRDARIWPIAATMLVAGTSVGMVLPVMPVLVTELGISEAQYGYVVGCFGLSKLLSNVPSAVLVSNPAIGRRGAMTAGLLVVAGANVVVSLATGFEQLALARLLSGGGVSLLLAGATNAVADISTPLNRSSMMAPMNIAFSSGTVMGPASTLRRVSNPSPCAGSDRAFQPSTSSRI